MYSCPKGKSQCLINDGQLPDVLRLIHGKAKLNHKLEIELISKLDRPCRYLWQPTPFSRTITLITILAIRWHEQEFWPAGSCWLLSRMQCSRFSSRASSSSQKITRIHKKILYHSWLANNKSAAARFILRTKPT